MSTLVTPFKKDWECGVEKKLLAKNSDANNRRIFFSDWLLTLSPYQVFFVLVIANNILSVLLNNFSFGESNSCNGKTECVFTLILNMQSHANIPVLSPSLYCLTFHHSSC